MGANLFVHFICYRIDQTSRCIFRKQFSLIQQQDFRCNTFNITYYMGTRIIPFAALLEGAGAGDGGEIVRESAYLRVRKLLYHIDRAESQDGSRVCSGWAFAKTWDGRCLPVNLRVAAPGGEQFAAEITRRARADVAEMFKLRRVENPEFGFDCVWQAAPEQRFCIYFSLGNRESIYEG